MLAKVSMPYVNIHPCENIGTSQFFICLKPYRRYNYTNMHFQTQSQSVCLKYSKRFVVSLLSVQTNNHILAISLLTFLLHIFI